MIRRLNMGRNGSNSTPLIGVRLYLQSSTDGEILCSIPEQCWYQKAPPTSPTRRNKLYARTANELCYLDTIIYPDLFWKCTTVVNASKLCLIIMCIYYVIMHRHIYYIILYHCWQTINCLLLFSYLLSSSAFLIVLTHFVLGVYHFFVAPYFLEWLHYHY